MEYNIEKRGDKHCVLNTKGELLGEFRARFQAVKHMRGLLTGDIEPKVIKAEKEEKDEDDEKPTPDDDAESED